MRNKIWLCLGLLLGFCLAGPARAAEAPQLDAAAYVLLEANSGQVG